MKKFEPTLEHAFYALALAIAVGLRFLHLGALPLSDFEANWALQALQITQGLKPAIGPNPAYVHLTAFLFYIFGATNFLARFWPALAGSALVLAAWFLRGRLGRIPALILAFGLAIDPGLVAMSHLAGGPMLAIVFLVLTALMWMDGRRAAAGLFAGLALLSGPSVWFGLAGVGLAWVFGSGIGRKAPCAGRGQGRAYRDRPQARRTSTWRNCGWPFSGDSGLWSLLAVCSSFLQKDYRHSLHRLEFSCAAGGPSRMSNSGGHCWLFRLTKSCRLSFGIAGVVRGILKRDADTLRLGIWALVALLLALIYPGRQTGDLVWALLPLWVLAAIELARHFDFQSSQPLGSGRHCDGGDGLSGLWVAQSGQYYEYGLEQ